MRKGVGDVPDSALPGNRSRSRVMAPYSFRVLKLCRPRPFDEQEIRRLSPAATFYRTLIAVTWSEGRGFQISTLVNTGEWSRDLHADLPGMIHAIPEWLIIHVRAPGKSCSSPRFRATGHFNEWPDRRTRF